MLAVSPLGLALRTYMRRVFSFWKSNLKNLTPRKKTFFCATLISFGIIWAIGNRVFATEIDGSKNHYQLAESSQNGKEQELKNKEPNLQHGEGCGTILNNRLAYCNNAPLSPADKSTCRSRAFETYNRCMGR